MVPNKELKRLLRRRNLTNEETIEMYTLIGAHVLSLCQDDTFKFKWNYMKYTLERKIES